MNKYILLLLTTLATQIPGQCDIDARVSKLETDMQKVRTETAYGNYGAKTAPANPQLDGYGLFATADLLVWKLYEGGTDYLLKTKHDAGSFPIEGDIRHFDFKWEPGFKVGAGYVFEHDAWEGYAEFTYFRTHANNSSNTHFPNLFPLVGDETLILNSSKGHWSVNFYKLDAVIGRNYFVSRYLALHPYFGLGSAWISQDRHFHFRTNNLYQIKIKSENDFWGIGPRLGINMQFYYSKNFSCFGNVSGDLLWGEFNVKESEKDRTSGIEFYDLRYNLDRAVPTIAFQAGMVYEDNFADDLYHFMVKASYENQYWWRQNQLPLFDSGANSFHRVSEDLSMQGFTLEFRLDF